MSKDLFSTQAGMYARYRPSYPRELIEYILSFTTQKHAAWDCATGNGQVAVLLADHFEQIFATDISEKQLSHAVPAPNIIYTAGTAEETAFAENSFDLITVAQAYHWFRFDEFYREATRVGKPNAVIAIWGYGLVSTNNEEFDALIKYFYTGVTGKYWDPERKYVDEKYQTVPFAFKALPSKTFNIEVHWDLEDFKGYLQTWSSVQHFIRANHYNPVDEFVERLKTLGNTDMKRSFSFPLFLRIGSIEK